jgi:hypothetical protein
MQRMQLLAAFFALAFAASAQATIPGNINERSRGGLQHVCVDVEPGDADYVECEAQVGDVFDAPYTAEECTAAGLAGPCELDFVPRVRVQGKVTIVYDDTPRNGLDNTVDEQTGVVLDLKIKGKNVRIYELIEGSRLGNWNPIGSEANLFTGGIVYKNPSETAFQFANRNLTHLGRKIVAEVDPEYPLADLSETLPLVTFMERVESHSIDASGDDPTASATVWKIVLEFVRVRD